MPLYPLINQQHPCRLYIVTSNVIICILSYKATEIRCQEKSKGGLSYEVILAEPNINITLPKVPVVTKHVSVEEIEEKLKAAEERRLSQEAKKKVIILYMYWFSSNLQSFPILVGRSAIFTD